jgi:hypothetical protein
LSRCYVSSHEYTEGFLRPFAWQRRHQPRDFEPATLNSGTDNPRGRVPALPTISATTRTIEARIAAQSENAHVRRLRGCDAASERRRERASRRTPRRSVRTARAVGARDPARARSATRLARPRGSACNRWWQFRRCWSASYVGSPTPLSTRFPWSCRRARCTRQRHRCQSPLRASTPTSTRAVTTLRSHRQRYPRLGDAYCRYRSHDPPTSLDRPPQACCDRSDRDR